LEPHAGPASQIVKLPGSIFQPAANDVRSIDRVNRRETGQKSAEPRVLERPWCAGCAFVGCVARIRRLPSQSMSPLPKSPFSGGDEPVWRSPLFSGGNEATSWTFGPRWRGPTHRQTRTHRRMIMDGVNGTGAQAALSQQQKDNSVENLQKQVENKKFTDALQTAKQLIQSSWGAGRAGRRKTGRKSAELTGANTGLWPSRWTAESWGSRRLRFVDPAITPALPLTGSTPVAGVTWSWWCRSSRRRRYQNPLFRWRRAYVM